MRRAPSPILLVTPVSAGLGSTPVLPQVRAAGVGWGQVGCMSGTCSTGFGRAQGAAVTPHRETWDWNLRQPRRAVGIRAAPRAWWREARQASVSVSPAR